MPGLAGGGAKHLERAVILHSAHVARQAGQPHLVSLLKRLVVDQPLGGVAGVHVGSERPRVRRVDVAGGEPRLRPLDPLDRVGQARLVPLHADVEVAQAFTGLPAGEPVHLRLPELRDGLAPARGDVIQQAARRRAAGGADQRPLTSLEERVLEVLALVSSVRVRTVGVADTTERRERCGCAGAVRQRGLLREKGLERLGEGDCVRARHERRP